MRKYCVCALALALCIVQIHGDKELDALEDVEKFIQQEIDKTNAPMKRSSVLSDAKIPSGKPDKISVSILKEYKVQTDDGKTEYISVLDNAQDLKSKSSSVIQDFIIKQIPTESKADYKIQKAKDLSYQNESFQPSSLNGFLQFEDAPRSKVPTLYKRKSMDGWIPMFSTSYIGPNQRGLTQQYKDFYAKNHFSKGAYYSPYKETLRFSASSNVPQMANLDDIQIQRAIPQLNFFTQSQVVEDGKGNLVNKLMNKANPSLSQIQEYGSTPQITSLLRERFRVNQASNQPTGKAFSTGGLPLRSLAQAIRNGAFSLENDVIPSSASEKPQEMEILIPHRFKMTKPKVTGAYSSVVTQGTQATAASITEPIAYGSPAQQQYGVGVGVPPRISPNAFTKGLRDYGDGVKYVQKEPIEIIETQPAAGYGASSSHSGGSSLNQLSLELEQRLRQLVQQEVLIQTQLQQQQQYGPPAPIHAVQEAQKPSADYGVPQEGYGAPGVVQGQPLASYGPSSDGGGDGHGGVALEYGPGNDHHIEHVEHHPEKPKKPFSLNLGFDTGFWGDPYAHVDVDAGDQIPELEHGHGGGGEHGLEQHHEGPSFKEEVVEKLAVLGNNLFHAALDFSRVYNPITFLEKVKEIPSIRFEVYDIPKKGHKKGKGHGHGHGHKKGHGHHGHGRKKGHGKGHRH